MTYYLHVYIGTPCRQLYSRWQDHHFMQLIDLAHCPLLQVSSLAKMALDSQITLLLAIVTVQAVSCWAACVLLACCNKVSKDLPKICKKGKQIEECSYQANWCSNLVGVVGGRGEHRLVYVLAAQDVAVWGPSSICTCTHVPPTLHFCLMAQTLINLYLTHHHWLLHYALHGVCNMWNGGLLTTIGVQSVILVFWPFPCPHWHLYFHYTILSIGGTCQGVILEGLVHPLSKRCDGWGVVLKHLPPTLLP